VEVSRFFPRPLYLSKAHPPNSVSAGFQAEEGWEAEIGSWGGGSYTEGDHRSLYKGFLRVFNQCRTCNYTGLTKEWLY